MFNNWQRRTQEGLSTIELLIAVVVLGVLASTALANFSHFQAQARRSELILAFGALERAQLAYHEQHDRYATDFDELRFSVAGGTRVSSSEITGDRYTYTMTQPWGDESYYCVATGNIDKDAFEDIAVLEMGRP